MLNKSIKYFVIILVFIATTCFQVRSAEISEKEKINEINVNATNKLLTLPSGIMNLILSNSLTSFSDVKKFAAICCAFKDKLTNENMPALVKMLANNQSNKILQIALGAGEVDFVSQLWQKKFFYSKEEFEKLDVNAKKAIKKEMKKFAFYVLNIAAKYNRINILDYIYQIYLKHIVIDAETADESCCYEMDNVLDRAAKYNNLDVIKYFKTKIPKDVNEVHLGYTVIRLNNLDLLKKMHHIDMIADLDEQFVGEAVEQNNYEMAKFLIDVGCKLIETDSNDTDGLIVLSIENNNLELLNLLAEQVVKNDFKFAVLAKDILNNAKIYALQKYNNEALKILLSYNPNLLAKDFANIQINTENNQNLLSFLNSIQNDFNAVLSNLSLPIRKLIMQYFGENSFLDFKINFISGKYRILFDRKKS